MTELGITASVDEPFLVGGIVTSDRGDTWLPVALAGRGFMVDMLEGSYERRSLELLEEQRNPGDDKNPLVSPEMWRRSQESWKQGAGQETLDRPEALPYRYFRSWNINPWDEWGIDLLPKVQNIQSLTEGGACYAATFGVNGFAVMRGNILYRWTDLPTDTSPDIYGPFPSGCTSMTSDGKFLYYVAGTTVHRINPADMTVGTFATLAAAGQLIRYVKGFLVVAAGNSLYDVSDGTPSTIFTHPRSDFRWVDGVEGDTAAYFLGGIGDKWMVHRAQIKDDGTTLNPPAVAAQLPDGEVGYSLGSYLGYIAIGVNTGFRFAQAGQGGELVYGRLIDTGTPVRCFEGQDRFLWYGIDDGGGPMPFGHDQTDHGAKFPVAGVVGIGRADLSTFTSGLTPAYAPDLNVSGSGDVVAVATVGGRRVFVVEGTGVYMETTDLSDEGWLSFGTITYNSVDTKIGVYAQITHEPLVGEVEFEVEWDDSGTFEPIRSNITQGSVSFGNIDLDGKDFTTARPRIRLVSNDDGGPRVSRVEMRSLPNLGSASEWLLPILISDSIDYENVTRDRDVNEDVQFLIGLVATRRPVEFREGESTYTVHATGYRWRPRQVNRDGSGFNGNLYLTLKELR